MVERVKENKGGRGSGEGNRWFQRHTNGGHIGPHRRPITGADNIVKGANENMEQRTGS